MNRPSKGFAYVASAYSSPDILVRQQRFHEVRDFVGWCLKMKLWVYSPIVHCHDIAAIHKLPKDHEYWLEYDFVMLDAAAELWVYAGMGNAWEQSRGVKEEITRAKSTDKPIWLAVNNGNGYITRKMT
jgi:hypothetical protein